jgi:hypothetical protein
MFRHPKRLKTTAIICIAPGLITDLLLCRPLLTSENPRRFYFRSQSESKKSNPLVLKTNIYFLETVGETFMREKVNYSNTPSQKFAPMQSISISYMGLAPVTTYMK